METNDLKAWWNRPASRTDKIDVSGIIRQRHSRSVRNALHSFKTRSILFTSFFGVVVLLLIYAFAYLRLRFSAGLGLPLILAGSFLLWRALTEYHRYKYLKNNYDTKPVLEAEKLTEANLKCIRNIDFIGCLTFFYAIAISLLIVISRDTYARDELGSLVWILIPILLGLPWFIRFGIRK